METPNLERWSYPNSKQVLNLRARNKRFRFVIDHRGEYVSQSAAISSVASKLGITAETPRSWVRQTEIDQGERVEYYSIFRPDILKSFGQA